MLKKFNLSTRIMVLGTAIIVAFALIFAWVVPKVKKNMYDAKYLMTKNVVEAAWGVLDYYSKQAKTNAITPDEAKKRAMEAIKNLRYADNEYFWINDMQPLMIMHPIKPEMDGKNQSDYKDPNGKAIFVAMVDVCKRNGAGFVDYEWPKPGATKPVPKISYVKSFPEWGWIIGSGIYLEDVQKEISAIIYAISGVACFIAIIGLGLAFFMARSISRPINRVVEGLSEGADQIASASGQVSSASQSLAEGAQEQASALEETSSSIEEMSSMTRQNAENANQANTLMAETSRVVNDANQSMRELTESMKVISAASEDTAKIIKTIDEIAFQTNLLALNAAVEAARAGEAGAGFAVVADEVRNLAIRASEAAKNTDNLIAESIKKIKNGSDIVTRTNEAFAKVITGSKKVGDLVGEIAAASNEQAQGIQQINKAVSEMDKVVQQNAATAEESAAASEEMNAQAMQMKQFVGDLAAVIQGSNVSGVSSGTAQHHMAHAGPKALALGAQLKGKARKAIAAPGKPGRGAIDGAKVIKPEQVIPMGDDDFKDF